jgi:opacity protein-like surface antigen
MSAKFRIGAAALSAVCVAAAAARADVKVTASAGGWEAFGGTTSSGLPVCGISKDLKEKYFSVKLFSGNDTFTVQLSDKDWTLQKGTKYDITMRFDQNKVWRATGVGFLFNDGDPGIEYTIRRQELAEFTREFGSSSGLVLHLVKPGLQDWTIDLTGVKDVKTAFETCNGNLK